MAKLILKSPYIKSTGGASGYLKYIATRERVEIIPDVPGFRLRPVGQAVFVFAHKYHSNLR